MSSSAVEPQGSYGKSTDGMRRHTTSLEPLTMELGVERTPVDRFFVCSGSDAPDVSAETWQLTIGGDAVEQPITIDWQALQSLRTVSLGAWLECAGNGRRMYELAGGHAVSADVIDTPWTLGGMGMAQWSGVALRDVLALAGLTAQAAWVGVFGGDHDNVEGEPAGMCLPVAKACHADTIIATTMNGEPLVSAHGKPARLVVPGWVAAYSIKWLERIEVSSHWVPTWRGDVYYRHRSADGADLGPATSHPVKSCLALPWPAEIRSGSQTLQGYARCGEHRIERVEISIDDGPWFQATLSADLGRWGWRPFTFDWQLTPGAHVVRTRAFDTEGNTQPVANESHPNTILWNAITAHPVVGT